MLLNHCNIRNQRSLEVGLLEALEYFGLVCFGARCAQLSIESDVTLDPIHLCLDQLLVAGAMDTVQRLACFFATSFPKQVAWGFWEPRVEEQKRHCYWLAEILDLGPEEVLPTKANCKRIKILYDHSPWIVETPLATPARTNWPKTISPFIRHK